MFDLTRPLGPLSMGPPTCYAIIDLGVYTARIPVYADPWHPVNGFSFWPSRAGHGYQHDEFFVGNPKAFGTQMAHNLAEAYRPEGLAR